MERIARAYELSTEQVLRFTPVAPDASFGSWMRASRFLTGKSVYDVQTETGISRNEFVFFESDRARPSVERLPAIAKALNVPLYEAQARLAAAGPLVMTPFALACRMAREAAGLTRAEANRAYGAGCCITQMENSRWMPSKAKLPVLSTILRVPIEVLDVAWENTKLVPA
jgi:transcriptional regulator with XRE-family HTH domain